MVDLANMHFPLYIATKDATFTVLGAIGYVTDYVPGKAYAAEDGYAYVYHEKKPKKSQRVPIFWFEDGEPVLLKSGNFSEISYRFELDNLRDYSLCKIVKDSDPNEKLFDAEAISDMIDAASVYKPIINETDDALKKCVKSAINAKDIDINRLKSTMDKKYMLSNLRQALTGKTKMSITNFNIWMESLGLSYDIIIYDNKTDPYNPLKQPLRYSSKRDAVITEESKKEV